MTRGGYRKGAGRKSGSNIYGEKTVPIRVPASYADHVKNTIASHMILKDIPDIFHLKPLTKQEIPFYSNTVSAGFPSPADDHVEQMLDLNEHLIPHQDTTFFLKVKGDSMMNAHILDGDLLIVDKSAKPKNQDIVIAVVYGEITVKRLVIKSNCVFLKPENENYPLIPISDGSNLIIWGVVMHVIHKAR